MLSQSFTFIKNLGWAITFLTLAIQIHESNGLHCYQCLSTDCSGNKDMCNSVRAFLQNELKEFYEIGEKLEDCPDPNNLRKWREKELDTSKCNSRDRDATCTLGRIRVTSTTKDGSSKIVSHATIIGCARVKLLDRLKKGRTICVGDKFNGVEGYYNHALELEHCYRESNYCMWDYCIAPYLSVVKPYQPKDGGSSFEKGWIIAIIVVVVLLFVIVIMADVWRIPFNWFSYYYPLLRPNPPNTNNNNEMDSSPPLV